MSGLTRQRETGSMKPWLRHCSAPFFRAKGPASPQPGPRPGTLARKEWRPRGRETCQSEPPSTIRQSPNAGREGSLRCHRRCRRALPRELRRVAQIPDRRSAEDHSEQDNQREQHAETGFHRVAGGCSAFGGPGKVRFAHLQEQILNREWTPMDANHGVSPVAGNSEEFDDDGGGGQRNDRNERKRKIPAFPSRAFVTFVVPPTAFLGASLPSQL
jgi:hypothetical protein